MIATIQRYMRQFGLWLAYRGGWTMPVLPPAPPPPPPCKRPHAPSSDLTALAARIVLEYQQQMPGHSGEAKRHQVLARLKKSVPEARERELALAIELAVMKVLG